MKIQVTHSAAELGIANPVGMLISNVAVATHSSPDFDAKALAVIAELKSTRQQILQSNEVRGFRELFARMGYPNVVPAGERLLNSLCERGFRSHNNVVDAYNLASAVYGSGLGMHDARSLEKEIVVKRAIGDETIRPLFRSSERSIRRGDLIYGTSIATLAWLGKRDVDSDCFKITDETTAVLLLALGNSRTTSSFNKMVCDTAFDLLTLGCPNAACTYLDTGFRRQDG